MAQGSDQASGQASAHNFGLAALELPSYAVLMLKVNSLTINTLRTDLTVSKVSIPVASQLHLGDCRDILPTLPHHSIDLILTDPPYGFFYRSRSHKLPLTTIANDRHEALPLWRQALRLAHPLLKEDGVMLAFTNWQCYNSMAAVVEEEDYEIKNLLIWEKNAWSRGDLKGNWGYSYEMVMYCKKKTTPSKRRRFLRGKREGNILKFKKLPTNSMKHPTEKPVDLLRYLIEKTTASGEVVLDMFMGSGGTIVAAEQSGRVGIGIELEPVWFEVAKQRLDVASHQEESAA